MLRLGVIKLLCKISIIKCASLSFIYNFQTHPKVLTIVKSAISMSVVEHQNN